MSGAGTNWKHHCVAQNLTRNTKNYQHASAVCFTPAAHMATVTGIACKVGRGIPGMVLYCVSLRCETSAKRLSHYLGIRNRLWFGVSKFLYLMSIKGVE